MKKYFNVLKQAATDWADDNCLRLGAALSYYTMTSLFPLLLIVTAVASFFLAYTSEGVDAQKAIIGYLNNAVKNEGLAQALQEGLQGATSKTANKGVLGSIIGIVLLLFSASGVFGELDSSFNIIWDIPKDAQPKGIMSFIRTKFLSFTLVLGVAFLLLVSTVLSTVVTALSNRLPLGILWTLVNYLIQIGVIAGVFALLFKYLPDTKVDWGDVLVGALFTAVLWIVGQLLLSIYFKNLDGSSAYGLIGSVLAFLIYIYYSSQILFFGGEVTQAYANMHGSRKTVPTVPECEPISGSGTVLVAAAYAAKDAEIAALKTRQYAAAATGGIIGLVGGAVVGGVGLVVGLSRGLKKIRGK